MSMLKREVILAADDLRRQTVNVPEWGGEVVVRSMTGVERDELEGFMAAQSTKSTMAERLRNFRALTVSLCTVDEVGERLFTLADVESLGRKSAAALTRIFRVAQELSALTASEVEELAKNSEPSPPDDSTSV